jgi:hypothetical protein
VHPIPPYHRNTERHNTAPPTTPSQHHHNIITTPPPHIKRYEFPEDKGSYGINDQYLLGRLVDFEISRKRSS